MNGIIVWAILSLIVVAVFYLGRDGRGSNR